jgi:hypothetical protein
MQGLIDFQPNSDDGVGDLLGVRPGAHAVSQRRGPPVTLLAFQ